MTSTVVLIVLGITLVMVFDYTNGLQDAANMLSTLIASRATTPVQASLLVSAFTFLGPVLGGTAVADTIGNFVSLKDIENVASLMVIISGLTGAISWNLLTWRLGLPASTSQALVGGLVGAVVVGAGPNYVVWGFQEMSSGNVTGVTKILLALLISPIVGFVCGWGLHRSTLILLRTARPSINRYLRGSQWVTTAALAFAYGTNDAQKGMGIIAMLLVLGGINAEFYVPFWVVLASASAITLGTLASGWRIVRTLGFGIYKVRPVHALDTQLTSAAVIIGASVFGAPVSTTQVVSTAIMGVGASERPKAVRWATAREIFASWVITIPGSALVSVFVYQSIQLSLAAFAMIG